jgi:ubiquinone/menaquinone biosynthesis C-methylase UbiE
LIKESDQLLNFQYTNSQNLDIRIAIHELYSTNKQDWHVWLMNQYCLPEKATILELGCGNGAFWVKNKTKIKSSWNITLSDFSIGMLEDAKRNVGTVPTIEYKQINIMDLPYSENSFDVLIANHMLYHVPDVRKALSEVRRVLKPGGKFYSSTIGEKHMMELIKLVDRFDPTLNFSSASEHAKKFGLENGKEQLGEFFSTVTLKDFEGGLEVTEVQPLIQYILSAKMEAKDILAGEKLNDLDKYVKDAMDQNNGTFFITKASGLFESY